MLWNHSENQVQNVAHGINSTDCGCRKERTRLVGKDDRLAVHREFWGAFALVGIS